MRRNIIYGIVLCELSALVVIVYGRYILPIFIASPFTQDFAQDYIGASNLLGRTDEPYPVLGPAFAEIGIKWNISHRSTHPPTTFLLAVPLALFNYQLSQVLWMTVMFACIILAARGLGLTWPKSVLAGVLSLAWPPAFWSLFNYTPIWLLGLVLAYRFRGHSLVSGIWIAFGSLPKYLAAFALLYHFRHRKWKALLGFCAIWVFALGLLILINPNIISAYVISNIGTSPDQIHRLDNGALVIVAWRLGGSVGLAIALALILWVLWSGIQHNNQAGWACLVWVGIALLPIAWVYSLLPLLPWLLLVLRASHFRSRFLAIASLLVPYLGPLLTQNPWSVALCIVLSGLTFAVTSIEDPQEPNNYLASRLQLANKEQSSL